MKMIYSCFGCGGDFSRDQLHLCGATADCLEHIGALCEDCMDAHQTCHALALEQMEVATLWLN